MQIKDLFREVTYPIKLYDKNSNEIYFEDSTGGWVKREYDENNNRIYYEDSAGYIIDKRPNRFKSMKELTVKEISDLLGYDIKIVK